VCCVELGVVVECVCFSFMDIVLMGYDYGV